MRIANILKTLGDLEDAIEKDMRLKGIAVTAELIRRRTSDAVALFAVLYPTNHR